ncbi:MAG TPA: galactosyldiacylglycerol synthase [Polyangia bacterium]|jgi:hypothetical protein
MPIRLFNKDSGALLGELTEDQLDQLADALESEGPEDHDYWINSEEVELLEQEGVDPALVKLLKDAVGIDNEDGIEIEWRTE